MGVVVPGSGFGRGSLGVAGCGRSPLLAEGLVGPPLCPSCVSGGPAAPLAGGAWFLFFGFSCVVCVCGAGGACALVCGVCLWGSCRWRLWWCVLCACAGVCAVCWWCVWVPVLAFLGLVWRLCVGVGAVCRGPSPVSAVWFPAPPGWGLLMVCPPAAPFACPPPYVSFPRRLGRRSPGAVPGPSRLWWVGGGPCRRLGSLPLVFPLGGADACTPRQGVTLLYGPSISTRSVQMDLLRSQVLLPFPTPGSGTLWVAGESLRDRRVSCLPRCTVCPTRSPSLGPNRSTCRGECSWSSPLVTPPGRCHRGPLTNGPGRIPPYCVCSGGADTVTGGGGQTPEVGSLACVSRGPFSSCPPFRCVVCGGGFPVSPGWGGGGVCGWGALFAFPGRVACVRVPTSPGCGSPSVFVFVARCVRAWCLCWRVCRAFLVAWMWVCLPCVLVCVCACVGVWLGPAGACCWCGCGCGWCVPWLVPRWLGSACGGGMWCVVCGLWCVVCGGGVLVGLWLVFGLFGWSLATPGGGSCVLLPATPGWVSLPVVVGVPRHSWLRVPGAVPRHSWLGFAVSSGGCSSPLLAEGPGCGSPPLLSGVPWRRWCVVCGVWCVVCGVRRWCVGGVVAGVWCGWSLATPGGGPSVLLPATPGCVSLPVVVGVPRHSWLRVPGAVSRHSWLGFAVSSGGCSSPLLAEGPGCGSPPLLSGVPWQRWCVVCGVWCVVCGVRRWCVGGVVAGVWCGWSLATPGGGPCVLLPATPGCVSLPVVVGVPRHSWLRVPGAVPRHSWLGSAGGRGVWCVVCGVWCVVWGGGVLVGLWLVFGVVGRSPLLAEVPVCYSPPLLAWFRCPWWWVLLATPG